MSRSPAVPPPTRRTLVALALLSLALVLAAPASAQEAQRRPGPPPPAPRRAPSPVPIAAPPEGAPKIEGRWTVVGGGAEISVRHLTGAFYALESSEGWEGVGILDDVVFRGVLHYAASRDPRAPRATGTLLVDWSDPRPSVRITYTSVRTGVADQRWMRPAEPSPDAPVFLTPPQPGDLPKFGEYVYVEELPEAITKVAPQYPEAARRANVEGTVMVQALVGRDGRIKDSRIVQSIPMLDDAAIASVQQWVFKPAMLKGEPVAVWVSIPVKFTLH